VDRVVYVAQGRGHPALFCRAALLRTPHWLSPAHAAALARDGSLRCQYKARYGQQPRACTLFPVDSAAAAAVAQAAAAAAAAADGPPPAPPGATAAADADTAGAEAAEAAATALGWAPSPYCRLQPQDATVLPSYLVVCFDEAAAAITPQQAFVLYDGERCLGAALIAQPGRSLFEEGAAATATAAAGGDG
jgi:tRNA-specific 2-thiouridylase